MSQGFELYPLIFSFVILFVFLNRFYQRYFQPCIRHGERSRVVTGSTIVILSISTSILLRLNGY